MYKSSCFGCGDRTYMCHSVCDVYRAYRNDLDYRKELITKAKELNKAFIEMHNTSKRNER